MDRLDAAIRAENDQDMFEVFPLDVRRLVQSEPVALIAVAQGFGINTDGIRLNANKPSSVQEINTIADNIIADPTHRFQIRLHPVSFGEVLITLFQKRVEFVRRGQMRKRSKSKKSKRLKPKQPNLKSKKQVRLGKRKL